MHETTCSRFGRFAVFTVGSFQHCTRVGENVNGPLIKHAMQSYSLCWKLRGGSFQGVDCLESGVSISNIQEGVHIPK